jgi:enolase
MNRVLDEFLHYRQMSNQVYDGLCQKRTEATIRDPILFGCESLFREVEQVAEKLADVDGIADGASGAAEDDAEGFVAFTRAVGGHVQVVGDGLLVVKVNTP